MLHKVFIISFTDWIKKYFFLICCLIFCFTHIQLSAQQSFDLFGFTQNNSNKNFRLNSIESNPVNFSSAKDFEVTALYGAEIYDESTINNLYILSIAKKIDMHNLYLRYTPGYKSEFLFNSGTTVFTTEDEVSLNNTISYQEIFGIGYAVNLNNNFTFGTSVRYFMQEVVEDNLESYYTDSVNYIETNTLTSNFNYWRGDLAIRYSTNENFYFSIASSNLFVLKEYSTPEEEDYTMTNNKSAIIGIGYSPFSVLNILCSYETTGSFTFGTNSSLKLGDGNLTFGAGYFHDGSQTTKIDGIIPSLNYSYGQFNFYIAAVMYLREKPDSYSDKEFLANRINNVINNQYSQNKFLASANVALSFQKEEKVKFIDVTILENIYPTLSEKYVTQPFAEGLITNISSKKISVKPSSYIDGINEEIVQSPRIEIYPGDTVIVPFYTVLSEKKSAKNQTIAQANFYLTSGGSTQDDYLQKPILLNDNNAWDGNVYNLKYYLNRDIKYSNHHAKEILSEFKDSISAKPELENFNKIKILFNHFAENMTYVSDPRASVEYVQFPSETINLKGGDCDDLSICYLSQLESVGIQTALVDYKAIDGISHVNVLVNTNLSPELASLITINDKKIFVRENMAGKEEIWLPVETTSLENFDTAWSIGANKFTKEAINNLGLVKGNVVIVDIN